MKYSVSTKGMNVTHATWVSYENMILIKAKYKGHTFGIASLKQISLVFNKWENCMRTKWLFENKLLFTTSGCLIYISSFLISEDSIHEYIIFASFQNPLCISIFINNPE